MERLDKLLSQKLNITRSEAKALIKKGSVTRNGALALSGNDKCAETDVITVDGRQISTESYVYIMMNKPKGVICATEDREQKTVIDALPGDMRQRGLFPAGRLDKDTTGFALITNDGEFAHGILSPKKHVDKVYLATLDKPFNQEVIEDFKGGMRLGDETLLSAELEAVDGDYALARVTLREGMYHQVKRMFKKHGITVTELKRISIGGLELDPALGEGECKYISAEDLAKITAPK